MSNQKATVVNADGAGETEPRQTDVTRLGTDRESDVASPRITQSDRDAVDGLLDDVLKKHPSDDEGKPNVEAETKGPPAIKLAERKQPQAKTLGDAKPDVKPPTEPKKPAAETKPTETETKTPPVETKPAAGETPAAPAPKPSEPQDPEIDSIQKPKSLSPQNDSNWETLRSLSKKYKAEAAQSKQIAEQLQKEAGKINPEVEKELTTLREMRRRFDLQNDPWFTEHFDKPMKERNSQLYGILKSCGMAEDKVKAIEDAGGPMSQSRSWWEETIIAKLNAGEPQEQNAAIIIKDILDKNTVAAFEREKEVAKAASGQSEWLKERVSQMDTERKKEQEYITNRLNEVQKTVPWANPMEVPKDATPEQKAAIEKHNEFYGQTVERLKIALSPKNVQEKVETALAACMAFRLNEDLASAEAKIAQLNEQIGKLKSAGSTSTAGKAAPATTPKATSFGSLIKMKNEDAVEAAMREAGI